MKAMNELVDEGHIRAIGVCNFSTASLKLAQSFSKYPIVVNQVHYNLLFREPQKDGLVEYCQNNDVLLMAWRPLQYGKILSDTEVF
jgi:diketogulonate reductase-like aldo/keto reductase